MSDEKEPEVKFKTLINAGIGISILLIVGIFIAIGVTQQYIAENPRPDEDEWRRKRDSAYAAQYLDYDVVDDYDDYSGDYYTVDPDSLELSNDTLRDDIEQSYYVDDYKQRLLDHLRENGDKCCQLIRELITDLNDTASGNGMNNPDVSIVFFDRTERDEALFSALFEYRTTTEDLADDAGVYDVIDYRNYLPLRENSDYGYVESWHESQFRQDPESVITFLRHLELDVRYYESQVLRGM